MSGIYIHGMEMPLEKSRVIQIYPDGTVRRLDGSIYNSHFEAVPVPDHGDLIDKSGVEVLSWTDGENGTTFEDGVLFVLDKLDELPVIIPADGEDYEVPEEEHGPAYESIKRGLEQAINGEAREEEI